MNEKKLMHPTHSNTEISLEVSFCDIWLKSYFYFLIAEVYLLTISLCSLLSWETISICIPCFLFRTMSVVFLTFRIFSLLPVSSYLIQSGNAEAAPPAARAGNTMSLWLRITPFGCDKSYLLIHCKINLCVRWDNINIPREYIFSDRDVDCM